MAGNGRGKVLGTSSNKYDKGLSVLEQYDLVSETTYRGRGSLLCQTEQGLKMIKPYTGSAKRLEKINEILEHLKRSGHPHFLVWAIVVATGCKNGQRHFLLFWSQYNAYFPYSFQ